MSSGTPGKNEKKESYVLFYSKRCGQSKKFIDLLQEYPHINASFEKMEVEMLAQMGKLPPQLTHTPGVIDGNQLIMGPNAFKWLEKKTKDFVGSSPAFMSKVGFNDMGFSFIGESESGYNKMHSSFDKPMVNGTDIDPSSFDSKSGQPLQQNNSIPQGQINSIPQLPPGLQSIKINDTSSKPSVKLPPELQSQTVVSGSGKITDSDMERFLASRENGI